MTKGTAQRPSSGQHDDRADVDPADVDPAGGKDDDGGRVAQLDAREAAVAEREAAADRRDQSGTAAGRAQLAEQDTRPEDDGRRAYTLTLESGEEVESDTGDSYTLVLASGDRVHSETLVSTQHYVDGQPIPVVSAYPDAVRHRRANTS